VLAPGDQLVVGADVDDPALIEYGDPVGQRQGGVPMGDQQCGPLAGDRLQRGVDFLL